jgi:hypothetical protein
MLTEGQYVLLGAMISAVAAVWAIGVAIYQFIYGYFARRHLPQAEGMASRVERLGEDRARMLCALVRNFHVFYGYVIAGALAMISIYFSGRTLASEEPQSIPIAYALFAVAVLWHFGLFTYELATSMMQVTRLAGRMNP